MPNLGISRPYIFDLMHKGSFIEHMTQQGFDFYLVDWGVFGPEDNDLTLEHAVTRILPRLARKALESSGAKEMSVLGYCMGAPLSLSWLASTPEFPLKNYVDMAGPVDFSQVGLFGLWLDARYFDADRFVDTLGAIPADLVKMGFKLLKPTMDLSTNLNLWWNLWNPEYVSGFNASTRGQRVPAVPRRILGSGSMTTTSKPMIKGELTMAEAGQLESIRCPVLAVGAREDNIAPPGCVRPLIQAVSSTDKEYVELPGGHISLIAGRGASVHCWPKVSSWLAARS